MQSDLTKSKVALRQQLLQQRRSLPLDLWQHHSQKICTQIQQLPEWPTAQKIAAYFSFRQEPDLSSLWENNDASRSFVFPRCVENNLQWHSWKPDRTWPNQSLVVGKYGILEPAPTLPLVQPEELDLLLVPCVGCDRQGYRLGYGGGFYDRLLADPRWAKLPALGITFQFAIVDHIVIDSWDVKLTEILTEQGKLII
jgi:5-formyltetrahydrofolate cyclo-ligase